MRFMVIALGVLLIALGLGLHPEPLIARFLPAEYASYTANYVIGLNLLRKLLVVGAVCLLVVNRHVAGLFRTHPTDQSDRSDQIARREWMAIAAITCFGMVLCLIHYTQGYTFDEVFLVNAIITQNPVKMFVHPSGSAHVLNSLPANFLAHAFGASEGICRLPALMASVLMPLALWGFARRVFSPRIALIAAFIVCVSPIHIWYAQEAKGNAWLMLLVPVSWWLLSLLAKQWRALLAIVYWLSLFLISLSHLSGVMFILATIPVFLLPAGWRPCSLTREAGLRMVTLHLLAAWAALMFYAPIIPFMRDFSKIAHVNEGTAKLGALLVDLLDQFTMLGAPLGPPHMFAVVGGALCMFGVFSLRKTHRGELMLFCLPFLIDLAITIGSHQFSFPRYHMYFLPALIIMIAAGTFFRIPWGKVSVAVNSLVAIAALGYGLALRNYFAEPKSNLKTLAADIKSEQPNRIVYVFGVNKKSYPASGLMYYTDRFDTDDTIRERLEGVPDDTNVSMVVIDATQFDMSHGGHFAALVNKTGKLSKTLSCQGELDQFRVRKSYEYSMSVGALQQALNEWFAEKQPHEN